MHPELAKILSDWEMDHDLALLLEKNKELHHFFANADVASISASLTPDNRKMLQRYYGGNGLTCHSTQKRGR